MNDMVHTGYYVVVFGVINLSDNNYLQTRAWMPWHSFWSILSYLVHFINMSW